jgi:CheY-like chemotaxis protein
MDLHMPIMDGYVAAKKIREKGILVPIIALTANLREDIESKLDTNDFNGVIVKPFLPEELYQKINTFLK